MCEAFVEAGMRVVLSDVEQQALERTTQALRTAGADVHGRCRARLMPQRFNDRTM